MVRSISNEHWKASISKLDVPEITPEELQENEALGKALRREDEESAKLHEESSFDKDE